MESFPERNVFQTKYTLLVQKFIKHALNKNLPSQSLQTQGLAKTGGILQVPGDILTLYLYVKGLMLGPKKIIVISIFLISTNLSSKAIECQ